MENFYLCNSAALQANLSKSAFKVYSFLAMSANNRTRSSFYKRSNIAMHCHMSVSTVNRAVRELCGKGLLEVKRRFLKKGQQTSNDYILIDNPQLTTNDMVASQANQTQPKSNCDNYAKKAQNDVLAKLRLFKCSPAGFQVKLSPSEMKVYSCLFFHAGRSGQCKPSKKRIASDCSMSVATVTRAIRKLKSAGLISIVPQTRMERYGNNGTSVNLYILNALTNRKKHPRRQFTSLWKVLFYLFFIRLTPSPMSPVTPHRTISRTKVTLKQRKVYFISLLAKCYTANIYPKSPWKSQLTGRQRKFSDSG